MSPQWGGIHIYNIVPPSKNATWPVKQWIDMARVMEVFLAQIRLLLNLHSEVSLILYSSIIFLTCLEHCDFRLFYLSDYSLNHGWVIKIDIGPNS